MQNPDDELRAHYGARSGGKAVQMPSPSLQQRAIEYAERAGYRVDESSFHRVFYAYCAGFTDGSAALKAAHLEVPSEREAWLEDLIEMAQEHADNFTSAYAGYKPNRHAHYAAVLKQARAALAAQPSVERDSGDVHQTAASLDGGAAAPSETER